MFKEVKEIITPEEAEKIKHGESLGIVNIFDHEIINKVVTTYQEQVSDKLIPEFPSYWRIESRAPGHEWHYDGCKLEDGVFVDNHMPWCQYGSTILLSDMGEFTGGQLYLNIDETVLEVIDSYLTGIIYTAGKTNNPVKHMVTPHVGSRTVLLMFFTTEEYKNENLS